MQLSNDQAMALVRRGAEALQAGRPGEARQHLEQVTSTGRANAQIWLILATACKAMGDPAAEEAALDQLLLLEPGVLRGHVLKGDCRARAGDDAAAIGCYERALILAEGNQVPDDLLPDLQRISGVVAQARTRAESKREAQLAAFGLAPEKRSPRFAESLDIMAGRKRIFLQQPTGYYFPGLPQTQFFEREWFDWVPAVEAATGDILAELNAVLATGRESFRPYLQYDPNRPRMEEVKLLDSADWSTLFLCENGKVFQDEVARCPRTWAAVQAAPLTGMANCPTVMFSLLQPGARIAAHTGMFNTRLVCHLPLIVPPGCRFRVGNEVREWEVGKLMIFDDTIEHEAWNDSKEDRVVLIFDIWRPELSAQERREIEALFAA